MEKRQLIKRGIKSGVLSTGRFILDLILPPKCLSCQVRVDQAHSICPDCFKELTFITDPKCSCCGYPFGAGMGTDYSLIGENLCGVCQKTERSFDKVVSALRYDDESRRLVIGFKHNDRLEFASLFSKLLLRAGSELFDDIDMIIPVPLHKKRLLERRYNQSALLSRNLSKSLSIKHVPKLLIRTKNTPPQQGNIKKRSINVRGAFKVVPDYKKLVAGSKVLLIDDVYTTGATAENCARALKSAGAANVYVLTVFRVIAPQKTN